MAREPSPGPARPGHKRQWDTVTSCSSNRDLDYKLYREDAPHRVYEYQRVPPLTNHMPVKVRRSHTGMGVKRSFSPQKAPRKSHVPPGQIKSPLPAVQTLHCIREELSQIKAQVDHLLESLEHADQLPGTEDSEEIRGPGIKGSAHRTTEPQQEPRGRRAHPEAGSPEDSRDPEEEVKNHEWDQKSGQ
ncbi:RNA-binding Raly-like protein [Desmodus rotundus]|uniref:RNA-binding Raly-like protein n=1 Tax=Desmodus rotundus TaxID=9430 RepID=UPI0023818720|nr:RNA-binding Raly-like protein [Desmodus rotundus]